MLIDSHCHLNCLHQDSGDLDEILKAAYSLGVSHFLNVNIDLEHFDEVISIANKYEQVKASIGVHPNDSIEESQLIQQDELLNQIAMHSEVIAIGETGLDYFRSSEEQLPLQQEQFRRHIQLSLQAKLPLIIHTRNARKDTITIMQEEKANVSGGVMHCFTEDWEMAKQALDLGFYISFSGILTFKNAKDIHEVAKKTPLEFILVETDSPYLSPEPYRGKPNVPGNVRYTAEYLAKLKGIPFEKVAEQTTQNFKKCFKWPI
jgi:TatD DNase family protein